MYNQDHVDLNVNQIITTAGDILKVAVILDRSSKTTAEDSILNSVMKIVGDAGGIYISTVEQLRAIWNDSVRNDKDTVFVDWLLQASIEWRIRSFKNIREYRSWVNRLSSGYVSHAGVVPEDITVNPSPIHFVSPDAKYVAVDDEYMQRLPVSDHHQLVENNLWFAFILTLQLAIGEVLAALPIPREES